jgi:hypothetical protein
MIRQQIKVITTRTDHATSHETEVNEFLAQPIEIVSIQNEVHGGNSFSKYHRSEIITVITYKGES